MNYYYAKNLTVIMLAMMIALSSGCAMFESQKTYENEKALVATQITQSLETYTQASKVVEKFHESGVLSDEKYVAIRDLIDGVYEDIQQAKILFYDGEIDKAKTAIGVSNTILNSIDRYVAMKIAEPDGETE